MNVCSDIIKIEHTFDRNEANQDEKDDSAVGDDTGGKVRDIVGCG